MHTNFKSRLYLAFRIIFLSSLLLMSQFCFASFDLTLPITIQSDHLEYNHQNGTVTHTGQVVVKQADKLLKADSLVVYNTPSPRPTLSKMVAKGTAKQLATFQGTLSPKQPPIEGRALTISYFPKTQKLLLEGNAFLKKEQDTFSSPSIQFDLASSIVTATKDQHNRPTLVIYKNDTKK